MHGSASPNHQIIDWMKKLIQQYKFYVDVKSGKEKVAYVYKLRAFETALKSIEQYRKKITSGKELMVLKGIDKGVARRVDEILTTGKLEEVHTEDIEGTHIQYAEDLMKIFGIGRKLAYKLYTVHGIRNIEELKKAIANPNSGVEVPDYVIKGLKYFDVIKMNIPREKITKALIEMTRIGITVDPEMGLIICGSYRREKPTCNDVDVILSHSKIKTRKQADASDLKTRMIQAMIDDGFIYDSLTSIDTPTKYMGLCKLGRDIVRIDIRFMPMESYYTAILYFTGSWEFNQRMRTVAKSFGYLLNEYHLYDEKDKPFKITSEKDVFDRLNMMYLQPVDRV